MQALADGLKGHKGLREMDLSHNSFGDEGAEAGSAPSRGLAADLGLVSATRSSIKHAVASREFRKFLLMLTRLATRSSPAGCGRRHVLMGQHGGLNPNHQPRT